MSEISRRDLCMSRNVKFLSKFDANYTKLFQGVTADRVQANTDASTFWREHFGLDVKHDWLYDEIRGFSNDDCLHRLPVRVLS